MVELVTFALEQKKVAFEIRQAWHYLFECWKLPRQPDYTSAIALQAAIAKDGWTGQNQRRFAEVFRPALTATRPILRGQYPAKGGSFKLRDLVGLDVSYPDRHIAIDVPDEQLSNVIPLARQILELAIDLEGEASPYTVPHVASIDLDPALVGTSSETYHWHQRAGVRIHRPFRALRQTQSCVGTAGVQGMAPGWRSSVREAESVGLPTAGFSR